MASTAIEILHAGDTINSKACRELFIFNKYKSSAMWHQIIINHNGDRSKCEILAALHSAIQGHEMHPCYYSEEPLRDTFFVRNCYDALEELFKLKLKIQVPTTTATISLTLRMNVSDFKSGQIDTVEQVHKVIGKAFNLMDKTLNLERFAQQPDLLHIDVPLTNSTFMSFVLLQSARRFLGDIEKVKLGHNDLTNCKGMRPLTWMKSLKSLDLSHNKIKTIADLEQLPKLPLVTTVSLSSNPVCEAASSMLSYIAEAKKIFPALVHFDGKPMNSLGFSQKNYLCSLNGYELVEQFLEHYFSTYDCIGRPNMRHLYTPSALLTMSCNLAGLKKSDPQISKYLVRSRNVLKFTNGSTALETTIVGAVNIESMCKSFGTTEHDYESFCVDMTHYTPQMVVLTVNGMFKEHGQTLSEEEILLCFVRTFVLIQSETKQGLRGLSVCYKISNEQVLIYRPSVLQIKIAFSNAAAKAAAVKLTTTVTKDEKEAVIIMFQKLTTLVRMWCIRLLEQTSWKFLNAMELFVHLNKDGKVPPTAFLGYEEPTKLNPIVILD